MKGVRLTHNGMFFPVLGLLLSAGAVIAQTEKFDFPSQDGARLSTPENPLFFGSSSGIIFKGIIPSRAQGTLSAADPVYRRQLDLCAGLSNVGTAVPYETFEITNDSEFDAVFRATTSDLNAPDSCAIDTFLSSYSPSFAPSNSNVNCVSSDNNSNGTQCSEINFSLSPGQTSVVVASAHANDAFFSYQVNFEATLKVTNRYPTVVGDLSFEDATYNRQTGDCGGLSGIATAAFYEVLSLSNSLSIAIPFEVFTSAPGDTQGCSGDTYITAYSPSFDPDNPIANCVTSNDDEGPGLCSQMAFDLGPEETVTIVVSSFFNTQSFDYQLNVTGPVVFIDGFESGNTGAWSTSQP